MRVMIDERNPISNPLKPFPPLLPLLRQRRIGYRELSERGQKIAENAKTRWLTTNESSINGGKRVREVVKSHKKKWRFKVVGGFDED